MRHHPFGRLAKLTGLAVWGAAVLRFYNVGGIGLSAASGTMLLLDTLPISAYMCRLSRRRDAH
jgi:hypothetical protein